MFPPQKYKWAFSKIFFVTRISLSILEYEEDLLKNIANLENSEAFLKMLRIVQDWKVHCIHIDVMRPPMVPRIKFPLALIKRIYEALHDEVILSIHLMTKKPLKIVEEISKFIPENKRADVAVIVQVEAFDTEDEARKALETIRRLHYRAGICLNLPTPEERLTDRIAEAADIILVMSVPMGAGGQKYSEEATERIRKFSKKFPNKIIEVDGGINPETILKARKAGAKVAVVGSYITANKNPEKALLELKKALASEGCS